ncbi:MAG: ribonuclease III domain-containing protein [Eubacteriales bacterium]
MEIKNAFMTNTTILAFMGDAIYESFVRGHVISSGQTKSEKLHKEAVKFVRADAQAKAIGKMFDDLTLEEQNLVKRARNKKITSKPKNVDPIEYKLATAFEALIGGLYLSGDQIRLDELLNKAIKLIQEENSTNK